MNYFLNIQLIKQVCGNNSYKIGKKYFEEKRVQLIEYQVGRSMYRARVHCGELFDVTIRKDGNGHIYADCTCPRLSSYHLHCQHVAAVLVCLHDIQINGFPDQQTAPLSSKTLSPPVKQSPDRADETPFQAKLFLDRVNNKLLAGLEFQYGLSDAEKAQEVFELMNVSKGTRTEGGYVWHQEADEYHFLAHIVPRLSVLVEIYATTAVRDRFYKSNSQPVLFADTEEGKDWLVFRFEMHGISEKEFREVLISLKEKRKYYRLRDGRLLSLETREFQAISAFLKGIGISKSALQDGELRVPLVRGLRNMMLVPEQMVQREASLRQMMEELQHPTALDFAVPEELVRHLKPYQVTGYQWLKRLSTLNCGGILADDMGLGKTLQSLAYISSVLPEIRDNEQPVLVVVPSSLVYNWLHEIGQFTPHIKAVVVHGSKKERSETLSQLNSVDVIITSYTALRNDVEAYRSRSFRALILDEAQAFKNHTTRTAKAVKEIRAAFRFALTGTPIENSIDEIWSIFHIVFPELMPSRKAFRELPRDMIARLLRPFLLRRMKGDVLVDLPDKAETIRTSDLLPEQKKLYAAYLAKLKHETLKHVGKASLQENRIKILAGLTRLRQLCCHPALFVDGYAGSSAKWEQTLELVEELLQAGKRILIFSQFTKMLEIMRREWDKRGQGCLYLDGNTPAAERVAICQRFNAGEGELFLISLKAGGTGLNLTGADTVILYDFWWNPAVEQQATDRAHRMGQKKQVQVIKLLAQGTIEERMHELQGKKMKLIQEIISPGHQVSSTLTEAEILEILA